jgi:hypothetical protein
MTILSSFEALAMVGWACAFQLRALEIIDEQEAGTVLTIGDFIRHERTEGIFDKGSKIGDGTEKLCEIALETIHSIHPEKLEIIKNETTREYVVLGKSKVLSLRKEEA